VAIGIAVTDADQRAIASNFELDHALRSGQRSSRAVERVDGENDNVGAIGVDGSGNETLVNADPGALYYPNVAFSPDYTQLVMGGFCDETASDVLVVFSYASLPAAPCQSGRVLTAVTFGSGSSSGNDPSWGPNGVIAYGSGPDVYFIPASGGQPVNMTSGLTGDSGTITASDPVWAPGCATIP